MPGGGIQKVLGGMNVAIKKPIVFFCGFSDNHQPLSGRAQPSVRTMSGYSLFI